MTEKLRVFQYEEHDLVQFTDGRSVVSPHYPDGWQEHAAIPRTAEAVEEISARSPTSILDEVASQGWSQIRGFEIREDWKQRWCRN